VCSGLFSLGKHGLTETHNFNLEIFSENMKRSSQLLIHSQQLDHSGAAFVDSDDEHENISSCEIETCIFYSLQ
jgi:hypothetical protein